MNIDPGPIALLGTSADPPTYGHQALLEGLLNLFPKVVTWASDNPMKMHGTSLSKRRSLLDALVKGISNPHLELIQELSSPWSITTVERAIERWPNSDLIFVIGSDLTSEVPRWVNAEIFLEKTRLGIAPREGWPINQDQIKTLELLGGRVEVLPLDIPYSSSSAIRNQPHISQIPKPLLPIMIKQNLYGFNPKSK